MTDTTATPEPPQQQQDTATAQKVASEAKRYRLRAKNAEEKLAAALAEIDTREQEHAARLEDINNHINALRLRIAADTIRTMNESRLTPDGHRKEPAYVHSSDGEPVRREILEMVLNSLDTQLGTVLNVTYRTLDESSHSVSHQVRSAADLFMRDADGNTSDRLNMRAVKALLRTLGRMDAFKAPPSKPKVTMPAISTTKPSRPATRQSVLSYAVPRAVRPYQRDPNIWPRG